MKHIKCTFFLTHTCIRRIGVTHMHYRKNLKLSFKQISWQITILKNRVNLNCNKLQQKGANLLVPILYFFFLSHIFLTFPYGYFPFLYMAYLFQPNKPSESCASCAFRITFLTFPDFSNISLIYPTIPDFPKFSLTNKVFEIHSLFSPILAKIAH